MRLYWFLVNISFYFWWAWRDGYWWPRVVRVNPWWNDEGVTMSTREWVAMEWRLSRYGKL